MFYVNYTLKKEREDKREEKAQGLRKNKMYHSYPCVWGNGVECKVTLNLDARKLRVKLQVLITLLNSTFSLFKAAASLQRPTLINQPTIKSRVRTAQLTPLGGVHARVFLGPRAPCKSQS